jgi:hypothetical protein
MSDRYEVIMAPPEGPGLLQIIDRNLGAIIASGIGLRELAALANKAWADQQTETSGEPK